MSLISLLLVLGVVGDCLGYVRVCYFAGWARYRDGDAQFDADDVDVNLCTHMNFAFASLDDSATHLKPVDAADDPDGYKRFTDLKKRNPNLKTMLSLGGWTMGSHSFSKLVSSNTNMRAFAQNTVSYLRSHNFDGLDLDWEYPAARGSPAADKHHFTQLVQILENAFTSEASHSGKPKLLLTAALTPAQFQATQSYEIPQLARYLDFINLMTYDFHGNWEENQITGHHSSLFAPSSNPNEMNVHDLMTWWVNQGAPKSKLVIGVPLYGRTWQLTDSSNTSVGAPATGPGKPGQYTKDEGMLAYYEICDLMTSAGATVHRLTDQKVPIMVDGERWTGFEDVQSVREKAQYVVDHNYAGIMVWALDMDDFKGTCGQKYPLMSAMKSVLDSHIVG